MIPPCLLKGSFESHCQGQLVVAAAPPAVGTVVVAAAIVLVADQVQPVVFSAWLIQIWFWVRLYLTDPSGSCLIFLLTLSDLFRVILVQVFGVVVVVLFLPWCTMVLLEKLVRS